ncbi:MAG: hypothetical protein WDN45_16195 [Caulobacteraceae bacterium]
MEVNSVATGGMGYEFGAATGGPDRAGQAGLPGQRPLPPHGRLDRRLQRLQQPAVEEGRQRPRRAQMEAEQTLGVRSQLIMCFLRDWSAEYAMATLLESLPYKEWIVGVGLDSDEKGNPPSKFAKVFKRAREEGYLLTMHCDVNQEDSVAHIWECVDLIGVQRIDHGCNSLEDPALCEALAQKKLGLTVCPISNAFVTDGPRPT